MSQWLSAAVLVVVGLRLVTGLRRSRSTEGRSIVTTVWRRLRWRHVWPVPLVWTAIVVVAAVLWMVPPLRFGWWTAIAGEDSGSPMFGSSETTRGTALEWVVPLAFIALLAPALPLWAYAEERLFRSGSEHWSVSKRIVMCLGFGVVHLVVGVPIAIALALSAGGAYFMWTYLREHRRTGSAREATLESTAAHTAYNAVVVLAVAVAVVISAVQWFVDR